MANTQPIGLKDFFKTLANPLLNPPSSSVNGPSLSSRTQTLPNGAGSFESPTPNMSMAPTSLSSVYSGSPAPTAPVVTPPAKKTPSSPSSPASLDYSKYINPKTGQPYSPQEYADMVAGKITGGAVPKYAGDALSNPDQSAADLEKTGIGLNNARNDIATGATDPYKVGSKSGIQYTPEELAAIEKAYGGTFDPAINDVITKLTEKQKKDELAAQNEQKLKEMALQHKYDIELKKTPSGDSSSGGSSAGYVYTPGTDKVVDSWAQRIYDGVNKITEIPAGNKGLRDKVIVALTSLGNTLDGRPTTTELGKAALANAKDLLDKFDQGKGTSAVGKSRIFGGSVAVPGTDKSNFVNDFNSVKSQLALEAVKYLKGQGSVSDAERQILSQAATKLNLAQSEDEFRSTLSNIINTLSGTTDGSSNVVTAPDGTKVQITD